ncbi:MAG: IclR family transcriptional regulator domain-containing protein [Rubripirellula sp.]
MILCPPPNQFPRVLNDDPIEVGYAVDRAEGIIGIHSVAAVIRDRHSMPAGALTVAAPAREGFHRSAHHHRRSTSNE